MRTIEEMKLLFKERGYNLLSEEYKGNKSPLTFERDGYKYQTTYNGFIKTINPKKWGLNNPYSMENIALYIKENSIPCKLLSKEYIYDNMKFQCDCGNSYIVSFSNFITKKQYNCPECGRKRSAEKHIDYSYLTFLESKELQPISEYLGAKSPVFCKNKEGYILKVYPYNLKHTQKSFDRIIFNEYNEYWVENYKNFIKLNNYDCELLETKPNKSHANIRLRCSCGDEFKTNPQWFRKGVGVCCQACSAKRSSSYEKKVTQWLRDNDISFIKEKKFDGCQDKASLKFDYYIPSLNLCIEIDGEQHYYPVKFGGMSIEKAKESFKLSKKRDGIKNEFCKNNNIKLLRIPYTEFQGINKENYINILKSHIFG